MRRPTYSNAISTVALFIVLAGGTAVALPGKNTVGSKDIRDGQVKPRDLKQPKQLRVKTNPEASNDPCATGRVGVLCGYRHPEVGYRGWRAVGGQYAPPTVSRDGFGVVRLSGVVNGVVSSNQSDAILILPKRLRPATTLEFSVARDQLDPCSGTASCNAPADVVQVRPNGEVHRRGAGSAPDGVSLDGISYRARR